MAVVGCDLKPGRDRAAQDPSMTQQTMGDSEERVSRSGVERPEEALIFACARVELDRPNEDRARRALAGPIDWDFVIATSARHGIAQLLHRHLAWLGGSDAASRLALLVLRNTVEQTRARNEELYADLGAGLAALGEAHIPVIVLKGAVLAELVYGDIGLRPMADVDILLPRPELERARAVLRSLNPRNPIDTQWHVSDKGHVWTEIPVQSIWDTARDATIRGSDTLIMSPEHQLLHLCLHGDFFVQLRWLIDVAEVIRVHGAALDWDVFAERAVAWRVHDQVYFKLLSVRQVLGVELPPGLLDRLAVGRIRAWLICRLVDQWALSRKGAGRDGLVRAPEAYLLESLAIARGETLKTLLRMTFAPERRWVEKQYRPTNAASLGLCYAVHPFRVIGAAALSGLRVAAAALRGRRGLSS